MVRAGAELRAPRLLRNIIRLFDPVWWASVLDTGGAAKARDVAAFTTTLDAASPSIEAVKEAADELGAPSSSYQGTRRVPRLRSEFVISRREPSSASRHNRQQLGAVLALRVAPPQERFVGTVAGALEDARDIPEAKPWYRAVYADDDPVGFVMLSWDVTPDPPVIIGPSCGRS